MMRVIAVISATALWCHDNVATLVEMASESWTHSPSGSSVTPSSSVLPMLSLTVC